MIGDRRDMRERPTHLNYRAEALPWTVPDHGIEGHHFIPGGLGNHLSAGSDRKPPLDSSATRGSGASGHPGGERGGFSVGLAYRAGRFVVSVGGVAAIAWYALGGRF